MEVCSVVFTGGAEKETYTTLIQPDVSILNAGRRNHFVGRIYVQSIEEKLSKIDPDKLDKIIAFIEREEKNDQ
jgi:hypothetical protein